MNLLSDGKIILAAIFLIVGLLALLAWTNSFPEYLDCLDNSVMDDNECLINYIMLSPPITEAEELKEACNESDLNCLKEVAGKMIEEEITN